MPQEWKSAKVTPIYKAGSKTDTNNYRPVSVIPVTMKMLERAVHDQLYEFLTVNNLISDHQSGFRKKHSTATALAHILDLVNGEIDQGRCCGMVFLDLKKAFDTVNHRCLLQKLEAYGVNANELKWFEAYLYQRTQVTCVNGQLSDPEGVTCGVPQGSILGPLLFILYVNDLPNVAERCTIALYGDDTALFLFSCKRK